MSETFEGSNPKEMMIKGDKDWWIRFADHQRKKIDELEELHRMQLAGVSTIARCNTRESLSKQMIDENNPYYTVALGDVKIAMEREIDLININKTLKAAYLKAIEVIRNKSYLIGREIADKIEESPEHKAAMEVVK